MFCDPSRTDFQRVLWLGDHVGLDLLTLVADTGIDPHDAKTGKVRAAAWQYKLMLDRVAEAAPDDLGLWLGAQCVVDGYGAYSAALGCFGTLRRVNSFLRRFHVIFREYNYFRGTISRIATQGDESMIELALDVPVGASGQLLLDELLVRSRREMERRLGFAVPIRRIELAATRAKLSRYEDEFACPVRRGAARTRIVVDRDVFDHPIGGANEAKAPVWEMHCRKHLQDISFFYRLGVALISELTLAPGRFPDMAQVADRLGASATTLKRWLQAEGASYQELVDEVRMDLFWQYARLSDLSPKQVAYVLGFANVHNLRRFMRRKTGHTIASLMEALPEREEQRGGSSRRPMAKSDIASPHAPSESLGN